MTTRTKNEITNLWEDEECLVSICCVTYNHSMYIEDCLKGFIMQKTNFKYEILIHDDASTDKTKEIIKKYETLYPNIIKPIYQEKNQKSIYKTGINIRFNYSRSQGKYIALCEGDDYWTDPLKLQKQVDFLETNPDFNICFHNAEILKDGNLTSKNIYPSTRKTDITFTDLLKGDYTKTCCSIFRYKKDMFLNRFDMLQDTTLFLICLENGAKAHYINETMAVYRIHGGGVWGGISNIQQFNSKFKIYEHLKSIYKKKEYTTIINHKLKKISLEISFIYLKQYQLNFFLKWQIKSFKFHTNKIFHLYFHLIRKHFFK